MSKRAVITGGVSGLGLACANRMREGGIDVTTVDLNPAADIVLDISDSGAVGEALSGIGSIDILINSAGIVGPNVPLWEISDGDWKRTFAVNVDGTFNMCRTLLPGMIERGWGRIVNFASMAGKDGNANMTAYSASKAAVIALTKSLGKETARMGVLVNAIAPAVIDTPMNATTAPDVLERISSMIPMGRIGRAEEVAELVAWLASDKVSFSTGAIYDISGGRATY